GRSPGQLIVPSWPTRRSSDLAVCSAGENANDPVGAMWAEKGLPLLETYCIDCHNGDFQEAELNLESYSTAESVIEHREHWERILDRKSTRLNSSHVKISYAAF